MLLLAREANLALKDKGGAGGESHLAREGEDFGLIDFEFFHDRSKMELGHFVKINFAFSSEINPEAKSVPPCVN